MAKRIFYFNITYGCNSSCVFCYSHNTRHDGRTYHEMSPEQFEEYLDSHHVGKEDRIIINGGEPLLHTDFVKILLKALEYSQDVLVYTNGRLLCEYDWNSIDDPVRFIVPIHGHERLHDRITRAAGSYAETIRGLWALRENEKILVDLKIIVNTKMLDSETEFERFLNSLENVYFNHAIHLTKMADTRISLANHCRSIENDEAGAHLLRLYEYYKKKAKRIKLFDACVKPFAEFRKMPYVEFGNSIEVFFKDYSQQRVLELKREIHPCMGDCPMKKFCKSAVDEYLALEIRDGVLYEDLE